MTRKQAVAKILEKTRNGKLVKPDELIKQVRLMLQSIVGRISEIQVNAAEDGKTVAIPGPLITEFAKTWRVVEDYDLSHQDPEEKEKLRKGTYGGIYQDSDGEPVDSEWKQGEQEFKQETPEA